MKDFISDGLIALGAAAICAGLWLVSPVAGIIAGGAFLIGFGLLIGAGAANDKGGGGD